MQKLTRGQRVQKQKNYVEGGKMPIKVTFIATRKKRIKVERIPAFWQEYIPIEGPSDEPVKAA